MKLIIPAILALASSQEDDPYFPEIPNVKVIFTSLNSLLSATMLAESLMAGELATAVTVVPAAISL